MSESDSVLDVIVVGAGLAGLRAALDLKNAGKRVLVLEARDRVGGRSMPGQIAGQPVDFGGQWVGPQQKLLLAQAKELGIATYPQYTAGASILSRNGTVSTYNSSIPKLPAAALLELGIISRRWRRDMNTLPPEAPWLASKAREWDAQTVESWIGRHVWNSGAADFVRSVVGALLCVDTAQVSYLFFLSILRRGHGLETMIGVEGGAQQDKFLGGAWQVPKRMADKLASEIVLNAPVKAIEQDAASVRVVTASGVYVARHAIVTVPPGLAARIDYSPAMPVRRADLLRRMQMGHVIKVHVAYRTPFWRRRGLNGSAVSPDRHVGVVFDQTPQDESMGLLVALIEGPHALAMSQLDAGARRKEVIADLTHYFGEDAAQPEAYVEHDWIADEWAQGGYAAYMPPGAMTAYGDALRAPFGRIHWAGTETATEWTGYLEGALQSGIRAAAEVMGG